MTLTAKAVGNRARTLGRLNFYVPLRRYGWAESAHQILLHYWFDQYSTGTATERCETQSSKAQRLEGSGALRMDLR